MSGRNKSYKLNVRLGRGSYGTLFCEHCSKRLGIILNKDYKYVFFVFLCNCGKEVIFQSDKRDHKTKDDLYVDIKDGTVKCRRCGKDLFYIDESKIVNFGFHIICDCGKEYNRIHRGFMGRKV